MKNIRIVLVLLAMVLTSACKREHPIEVETYLRTVFSPLPEEIYESEDPDAGYSFDFNVQLPQGKFWSGARATIIDAVTSFGESARETDGRDTLKIDGFIEGRVAEYIDDIKLCVDESEEPVHLYGGLLSYSLTRSGQFIDPFDHYETYFLYSEDYLGGPHGNYSEVYLVFDADKGRQVQADEFIKAPREKLKAALVEKLGAIDEVEINEFTLEEVLTPNFYVSDKGVTFVYQPYQVASYAAGIIEVTLTWDEVSAL